MSKHKSSGEFLGYMNLIRGVAIVLIVASHVFYGLTDNNAVIGFINATVRNSTVIFLFISGFLFQYLLPKFRLLEYYKRKFQYVVMPYMVYTVLIVAARFIAQGMVSQDSTTNSIFSLSGQILDALVKGSALMPYWYIPVIVLFFILAPVWVFIDKNPKLYWLIPVMMLVSVFIPRDNFSDIPMIFTHFISVYMLGMFFARYRKELYAVSDKYNLVFSTILVMVTAIAYIPDHLTFNYWWTQYLRNIAWCWGMFYWFQKLNFQRNRILEVLAEYSFGIYFIHFIFCAGYKQLFLKLVSTPFDSPSPLWIVVFIVGLGFSLAGSTITLFLLKKILKGKSRMVIGA